MKLLLYCTKANPYLNCDFGKDNHEEYSGDWNIYLANKQDECSNIVNGKIVAECDFEVERIFEDNLEDARDGYLEHFYTLESYDDFDEGQKVLLKESCLQKHELSNYLGFENGYAIHIKNLHIFDEPIKLEQCHNDDFSSVVNYAPQNMMYSWLFTDKWNRYALISIKPEWLCKILNGEKTIEVRKKVLKEMLNNE